jgi:hypothetical protein
LVRSLRHAALVALVDAFREPAGGQSARDFRTVQRDARQDRARQRPVLVLFGQCEQAQIEFRLRERAGLAFFERAVDLRIAQSQRRRQRTNRRFGRADRSPGTAVTDQVAIESDRNTRCQRDSLLECGIAAGVEAGVVIGEAI